MRYRLLGRSALRVSELCLGTMTFGEEWGWGASRTESQAQVEGFGAAGGNFIDTANYYTGGTSERYVGEIVADDRDHWVIATKYTLSMRPGDPNYGGNHRKNMVVAVRDSLKRLRMEYIDLLWVHAWDALTPAEELMRALDDLVRGGSVLHVGISDTPAWMVAHANTLATMRGWTPFTAIQVEYSLIERTTERDLIPMANAFNMGVTPWSPLGQGVLTGKYLDADPSAFRDKGADVRLPSTNGRLTQRNQEIARAVVAVAREIDRTPAQVAVRWLLDRPSAMIPILGARSVAQLSDVLQCTSFTLGAEHLARLDAVSAIEPGFPTSMLMTGPVQDRIHSGPRERIVVDRPPLL
jgi:aryl-alcohol dehydrogenase-like predicted oxidoreductase